MAKPFIAFVLRREWGRTHGFSVLGVTSEKRGMIYGRDAETDVIRHFAVRDLIHRFPEGTTQKEALGAVPRARAAHDRIQPSIDEARRHLYGLEDHQRRSVLDAAMNPPRARPPVSPTPPDTEGPGFRCHSAGLCECERLQLSPMERGGCDSWRVAYQPARKVDRRGPVVPDGPDVPPPPTKWHSLDDVRTWKCLPGEVFVWATDAEMLRAGVEGYEPERVRFEPTHVALTPGGPVLGGYIRGDDV